LIFLTDKLDRRKIRAAVQTTASVLFIVIRGVIAAVSFGAAGAAGAASAPSKIFTTGATKFAAEAGINILVE
jgi:hypothetical protein